MLSRLCLEAAATTTAWLVAAQLWKGPAEALPWGEFGTPALLSAAALVTAEAWRRGPNRPQPQPGATFGAALAVSTVSALMALLMVGPGQGGPLVAVVGGTLSLGLLSLTTVLVQTPDRALKRSSPQRPVVVVGAGPSTAHIVSLLDMYASAGCETAAVVITQAADTASEVAAQILRGCRRSRADTVILAPDAVAPSETNALTERLQEENVEVYLWAGLLGISQHRLRPARLGGEGFFSVSRPHRSTAQAIAKRAIDIVAASTLLIVLAPLMAIAGLVIKHQDGAQVIFRQQRLGRHGQPFTLLKLRTMVINAESAQGDLAAMNERNGPLFKVQEDPRVTRFGRFLRRSGLDELPQLINVLRGEMSLVGPRPALPQETAQFSADLRRRLELRPGLTGLWQVEARGNPSFHAYQHLDLFYLNNQSFGLDVRILWRTVELVWADLTKAKSPRLRTPLALDLVETTSATRLL